MSEHRIYEKKHDINTQNTQDFYNGRAKRIEEMDNPYVAVLLGDQDPKHAVDWNEFEKKYILPELALDKNSTVIDIGCGIGRWAEIAIPESKYYFGTDFSADMVKVAEKRCKHLGNADFYNASFNEIVKKDESFFKTKFNRVLLCGVCMYINESDLKECFKGLLNHIDEHCVMYFTDTVAVETRLTLDECPSVALKTNYDVIYRTPDEYNEFYKVLFEAGFKIRKQDFLPHLNNEEGFSETDRWYTILER